MNNVPNWLNYFPTGRLIEYNFGFLPSYFLDAKLVDELCNLTCCKRMESKQGAQVE